VLAAHRQVHAESSWTSMSTSISTLTSTSISTMNEPFQVKDFRHLSGEQRSIAVGVMQAVLMHALQLRRTCREVFLLCDIQRHSLADAAAILGISQVVAKRRLQLARRRMNDVIERLCGPI
jgi:DNA-directed RNA polymerase specialized sigma24 family protein